MDNTRPVIVHYGVKGMRWGVRNDDPPTGGYSGSKKVPSAGTSDSGKMDVKPAIMDPETLKISREQRLQARESRLQKEAQEAKAREARLQKAASQAATRQVLKIIGGIAIAAISINVLTGGALLTKQAMQRRGLI